MEENKNNVQEVQNEVNANQQEINAQQVENTVANVNQNTTEQPVQETAKVEQQKSNSKIILIVIAAIVIILVVVVLVFMLGGNKKPNPTPGGTPTQQSQIEKKVHIIEGTRYLAEITNNKSTVTDLEAALYIYEDDNEPLRSIRKDIKSLGIGESTYVELEIDGLEDKRYEVVINNEKDSNTNDVFTKQVELKHQKENGDIIFTLKNNSTQTINVIEFEVLYYKDNKIIKYNTLGYNNLEASRMLGDTIYTPQDKNGKKLDFDKYELIVRAYNQNNENVVD